MCNLFHILMFQFQKSISIFTYGLNYCQGMINTCVSALRGRNLKISFSILIFIDQWKRKFREISKKEKKVLIQKVKKYICHKNFKFMSRICFVIL